LLKVDAADRAVELVLPRGVSPEYGFRFLQAQQVWLATRLAALPHRVPFVEGAIVPVLGTPHRIRHETDPAAPPVAIVDGEIRVRGDPARHELTRRARVLATRIGKHVTRITVRDTTTRWGSCSATGCLSFSWRLILAPESVLDYVVAHEVAHLAQMNHGPRFWRIVQRLTPDHKAPRAWLTRHRSKLWSYG
jgi:predicted metal-dependent hydrolase